MSNITVSILDVAGYEHAVRGARLSRNSKGNKEQDFLLQVMELVHAFPMERRGKNENNVS